MRHYGDEADNRPEDPDRRGIPSHGLENFAGQRLLMFLVRDARFEQRADLRGLDAIDDHSQPLSDERVVLLFRDRIESEDELAARDPEPAHGVLKQLLAIVRG